MQIDLGKLYDMKRDSLGVWSVTTAPQSIGFHYYSLVIDGLAIADPASQTFYGMGRMASGIEIPFEGDDFYAVQRLSPLFTKRRINEVIKSGSLTEKNLRR